MERREIRAWAPLFVALMLGLLHPIGGILALALAMLVAIGVAVATVNPEPPRGLRADLAHLGDTLVRRHLAWRFTVVGPPRVLPAVAGTARYVDGLRVRELYPAATYRYDPDRPELMIATRYTYIVAGADPSAADREIRRWIAELGSAGVDSKRAGRDSTTTLDVYRIERDPDKEETMREKARRRRNSGRAIE